ncbi:MAG TPA: (2Fe-2S)-binding protein [Acidimicrobiia bacterium]|jgi:carbon-monoxide dehydrogenase small subunit
MRINLSVNGQRYEDEVEPNVTLVEWLRERVHLTGTKEGCGVGECGSCLVLVDGHAVNACLLLAVEAGGHVVITIEGLAAGGVLSPVQAAFVAAGAVQCGYCTPAMAVAAESLLRANPSPEPEEIRDALSGVLCRCGTYQRVLAAIGIVIEQRFSS